MIKESKTADFLTTGRQPSEQEFARISEWIKKDKQKQANRKKANRLLGKSTPPNSSIAASWGGEHKLGL
jgi:hypothetical protein